MSIASRYGQPLPHVIDTCKYFRTLSGAMFSHEIKMHLSTGALQLCGFVCRYHGDAVGLVKACFGDVPPPSSLRAYMDAVYRLGYTDRPDYDKLKELFTKELKGLGCRGDGRDSLDWITSGKVYIKII